MSWPSRSAWLVRFWLCHSNSVAADEVVLVLELRAVAGLVERGEQEDVPGALDEPDVPDRGRELQAEERRDLLPRVAAPELELAVASAERAQVPAGTVAARVRPMPRPGAPASGPNQPRRILGSSFVVLVRLAGRR